MTDRRKPSTGFWISVALVAVLVYLLASGPAARIADQAGDESLITNAIDGIYSPIMWIYNNGPQAAHDLIDWWLKLWGD